MIWSLTELDVPLPLAVVVTLGIVVMWSSKR